MSLERIVDLDARFGMQTYSRARVAFVKGEGAYLWDTEGKKYVDFVAGLAVNGLGHCHPNVVKAIKSQAERLLHCSNLYYIAPQAELAALLAEISPCKRAFFCSSGAEANEAAIKLARKYFRKVMKQDRAEIVTFSKAFHGRTMGALAATPQKRFQEDFQPLPEGFKYLEFNDAEALLENVSEKTAAVMVEPIQGEGGIHIASDEFMAAIETARRKTGALVIFDEVQCGLGRTGKLFAFEHYGIRPDIITLAKSLGGGVPIGAMLAQDEVASAFAPGDHGSTFGGNPLCTSAALAAVRTILDERLTENAATIGQYLLSRLHEISAGLPAGVVREIRGRGLMVGIEISFEGKGVVSRCLERGLIVNCTDGNVIRLLPPLIIGKEEVDQAVRILGDVLSLGKP
ncbi:MAG TPA: aspartate aminotransferase family protein [Clostridia bacterium]|nr:aspartate aminotransferase family protein [Clostridia bacterium]